MLLRFRQLLLAAQWMRSSIVETVLNTHRVDLACVRARHRNITTVLTSLTQVWLPSLLHSIKVIRTTAWNILCRLEELFAPFLSYLKVGAVLVALRTLVYLLWTWKHAERWLRLVLISNLRRVYCYRWSETSSVVMSLAWVASSTPCLGGSSVCRTSIKWSSTTIALWFLMLNVGWSHRCASYVLASCRISSSISLISWWVVSIASHQVHEGLAILS